MSMPVFADQTSRPPNLECGALRAGIVGTGYISGFHAAAIQKAGIELASVCDPNLRAAQSFAAVWRVPAVYDSLEAMLRDQRLHVVHILVPPDRHHSLAKNALESGVSVFLEKPFCVCTQEADELLALARRSGLFVGVCHNFLYAGAYRHLRDIVRSGIIGPIDYISFNHFAELGQIRFGPFDTWMLRSPGNVILETGPHLFSALVDLVGTPDNIEASADRSVTLPGGAHVFRRWRVRTTVGKAAIDLNLNFGPGFNQKTINLRGLLGTASLDFEANTCSVDQRGPLSIDLDRLRRSRSLAKQIRQQAGETLRDYILSKLKLGGSGNPYQTSFINIVRDFYSALRTDATLDPRIDGASGRAVVDLCVKTIRAAGIEPAAVTRPTRRPAVTVRPTILILGGAGFIALELIRQLLSSNYAVRALVRGSAAFLQEFNCDHLEIVRGDIRDAPDLKAAMQGIDFVFHLAHAEAKTWEDSLRNEIAATRSIAELCLATGVKRLIYTGTIASYYTGKNAGTITEQTALDPNIRWRDYYSRAKAAAEDLLMEMHAKRGLAVVIFRPGIVIGKGGNPFHWGVGRFSEGVCEVWGSGHHELPFVLAEDVAAALVRGIQVPGIEGRSYNLVDCPLLTAQDYLAELQRRAGIKLTVHYRSIWHFYLTDFAKWVVKLAIRHPDRIRVPSYRDWESRSHRAKFDCSRARAELGWSPAADRRKMIEQGIGGSLQAWLAAIQ